MREELKAFERLLNIMDELRAKCPWDKSQTIESLRYLTIEETYELSEAIIRNDMDDVRKELGDLMLHIVFYSKISSEKNDFNITDVLNGICEKLIVRHPHIYADVKVANADDVKSNWEKIKLKTGEKSVLAGVPASLPAMVKAYRIQEKVSGVGFDWEKRSQVFDKVMEEANELKNEVENNLSAEKTEQEFGDLIFALINYARFINVNPEDALEKTNIKFIKRFSFIEKKAKESGRRIQELSLAEMDSYWNESKLSE
ncbi:MAG TPA: nucleoside triphosphate pyrophosphohydrolase [Bacteroidales bacterium]|nr:nucleoside triphosphate pyrophosphohydrolase [Bacteroidales bacterium]